MSLVATPKRSARRCLFGRPTQQQQEATRKWLENELEELSRQDSEKWGFDFKHGIPVATCSLYTYEVVSEAEVPEFYRSKHISATLPMSSPSTSEKEVSLLNISSCSESDVSMEFERIPQSKRVGQTPKKRRNKLTDFIPIRRKKIERSTSKESPVHIERATSTNRSPRRVAARHF